MAFDLPPMSTPASAICARPNIPAAVLRTVAPELPPLAEQQGIRGVVQVIVSLSPDSRVVAVRILRSPSAVLNEAALAAARASTFQTEIRNCRALAADYIYSVDFEVTEFFSRTPTGETALTLTANGVVTRAADRATVLARITTTDLVEANATAQNDATLAALQAKLRAIGIGDALVRTTKYVTSATTQPGPRGFVALRDIEVTVNDVANAARAATVVATSAPTVDRTAIVFTLADRAAAQRDALKLALRGAEPRAQGIARAHHVQLGALEHVDVSPQIDKPPETVVPFPTPSFADPSRIAAIAIPNLEVRATANVTYQVKP